MSTWTFWVSIQMSGLAFSSAPLGGSMMSHPRQSEHDGGQSALHRVSERDGIVALCIEGEWDMGNAPRIDQESAQVLDHGNHLILDLSRATFIDSSVIRALFGAQKQAATRGRVAVLQLGTAATVELALGLSRIERVLPRAHSRGEAIATIQEIRADRAAV
jgi:anti-sigma B factor antagonist